MTLFAKKKTSSLLIFSLICVLILSTTSSCGVYSFSGVNIPPDIKTVFIGNFFNNSGNGPADLGQVFTQDLKDYFQQNTNLSLVNSAGDIQYNGSIVSFTTAPVAPTASTSSNPYPTSSLTRLTITVKVEYVNTKDEKSGFDENFSFYQDFAGNDLAPVERDLIEKINEQIVLDIFNKSLSNW